MSAWRKALAPGGRLPRAVVQQAWAAADEAAALQDDYPGVTCRQVPVYGGFGLAARWRVGRRELWVTGPVEAVWQAVEEDPPGATRTPVAEDRSAPSATGHPAGEAPPRSSPAGQHGTEKGARDD